MRIISGLYKNRRIHFNHLAIRPTTNFAKESLFNLLNNHHDLTEITVLDLFAGSGSISYEFISRGAKTTAVDQNIKCFNFMKTIKSKLDMKHFDIILSKSISYLKKTKEKYDIIFADPPYKYTQTKYDYLLQQIIHNKLLNNDGTIVIEHSKLMTFDDNEYFFFKKKYGNVHFTFFKNEK